MYTEHVRKPNGPKRGFNCIRPPLSSPLYEHVALVIWSHLFNQPTKYYYHSLSGKEEYPGIPQSLHVACRSHKRVQCRCDVVWCIWLLFMYLIIINEGDREEGVEIQWLSSKANIPKYHYNYNDSRHCALKVCKTNSSSLLCHHNTERHTRASWIWPSNEPVA